MAILGLRFRGFKERKTEPKFPAKILQTVGKRLAYNSAQRVFRYVEAFSVESNSAYRPAQSIATGTGESSSIEQSGTPTNNSCEAEELEIPSTHSPLTITSKGLGE